MINSPLVGLMRKCNTSTTRLKTKLKKIWAIIRNKDFRYSEIVMSKEEFDKFRKALNKVDSKETLDK